MAELVNIRDLADERLRPVRSEDPEGLIWAWPGPARCDDQQVGAADRGQRLPKTIEFRVAEGVDGGLAIRHLQVIQASFEPKHEHKEAAVAYLASPWFTDFAYEGFR